MNPEGGGCGEPRSCHCTLALAREHDKLSLKKRKKKNRKKLPCRGNVTTTKRAGIAVLKSDRSDSIDFRARNISEEGHLILIMYIFEKQNNLKFT